MKNFLFLLLLSIQFGFSQTTLEKAEKLYADNKLLEAKEMFSSYLASNPNQPKCIEYLGDIAGKLEQWDEAIKQYDALKTLFPKNANYYYKLGGAMGMKAKSVNKFKALGMIDKVESTFLTATKLDAKHIDSRLALVMFYLELPAIVGGSETKAQKFAAEIMNISLVEGYLTKGYIDVYFDRYHEALTNYSKAYKIENSQKTYERLYDLYLNKMQHKSKARQLKEEYYKLGK